MKYICLNKSKTMDIKKQIGPGSLKHWEYTFLNSGTIINNFLKLSPCNCKLQLKKQMLIPGNGKC